MDEYPLLKKAYDFDEFEKNGKNLIQQLSKYLHNQQAQHSRANNWDSPDQELKFWSDYSFSTLEQFLNDLIAHSIHIHNPKFMGHQVSAPIPIAILGSLISNTLNNGSAIYEMGRASTAIEKCVIELFCTLLGYDKNSSGIMTSGGTLANLTALLTARQVLDNCDVWQDGNTKKLAILVSSQAHYCIDRAAKVMGLGSKGIVLVPVNENFELDITALEASYKQTISAGFRVIAIVGSACSTATGRHDDLKNIGKFCKKQSVWFHVDAAHGGAAIFSNKNKNLLQGINLADSVVIDTHKMLMTPALSTVVLYKNKAHSAATFHQKAHYLFADKNLDEQWYNSGLRTFECTKLMMCLKFYLIWQTYGIEIFEENVDCLYALGQSFATIIKKHPCFELAIEPQTNIVCFRYIIDNMQEKELNNLNRRLRHALLVDEEFYVVQVILNDIVYIRVTLMNPFTKKHHLESLLTKLVHHANTNH